MYKIEDNVPIPGSYRGRTAKNTEMYETLHKVEIGQSFVIPIASSNLLTSTQGTIHGFGKKMNRKFSTRRLQDGESLALRVWRME